MRMLLAAVQCEKHALRTNLDRHVELVDAAAHAGCDLVVLPEFSLTGSVDVVAAPDEAIARDDPAVATLVRASAAGPAVVFGLAERSGAEAFISQAVAVNGRLRVQRKRHLGEDEHGYATGSEAVVFEVGTRRVGIVICAESQIEATWDATHSAGADVVCLCSAPGLYGRRRDDDAWRDGFEWWEDSGLADARRHARRLGVWVALVTQAGSTVDEDFPGIAALVGPDGAIVERLPDWRPGTLVVEVG